MSTQVATPELERILAQFLTDSSLIQVNVKARLDEIKLLEQAQPKFFSFLYNLYNLLPKARKAKTVLDLRHSELRELNGRLNHVQKLYNEYKELQKDPTRHNRQQETAIVLLLNWERILRLKSIVD